ncbi:MAG: hypothetical protein ACXADB_09325, partial [Candidatus Hermodarchaeia archaeon]
MRNSRFISVVLLVSLLFPMFIAPAIYIPTSTPTMVSAEPESGPSFFMEPMAVTIPPDMIRVAIYNEPNTTSPSYEGGIGSINTNSSSQIAAILQSAGYQITMLSTNDIYNHQLMTARFDVFVIPDTLPRENITNQVYEFWLGGGSLLGFDSFAVYSCFMGILPPEAAGTNGVPGYWGYMGDGANVTTRHPVSKGYAVNDTYVTPAYGYAAWDWTALMGSVIGSDLTRVAHDGLVENEVTVLAFDPTTQGGRVVHFWWDGVTHPLPGIHQMVRDAVQWLCPRPKGRIAFDLSHLPRRSIDPWDGPFSSWPDSYKEMRDEWVSHGFLVDKLYPAASGNNFTTARLAPYDLLVVNVPDYNYTAGDRTAFQTWANAGGSVLAFGDWPDPVWFKKQNHQTSMLLSPFGLTMHDTAGNMGIYTSTTFSMHPITEGCSSFYFNALGYVNVSGSATGIWFDGPNIAVAASTYGSGRAILVADMNWVQDGANIANADNRQSILNMANWLTASHANVLLLSDFPFVPNEYKAPPALALNDLGVKWYSCFDLAYFNLSLNLYPWDLVIIDRSNNPMITSYYDDLIEYIDAGGHFLFSYYNVDGESAHPLWARLGCEYSADVLANDPAFIWDGGHDIFNQPISYGANNFTFAVFPADDGDRMAVFTNATALGGFTSTPMPAEAAFILRNDRQTLFNSYLISACSGDIDDSTYADNFELWMNEIAFMLAPRCT